MSESLVRGTATKGPFEVGSTLTAYALNPDGSRSLLSETLQTTNPQGTFQFSLPWSGPTELEISGIYLNENTGKMSTQSLTLCAIVEAQAEAVTTANLHLGTHLACERVRTLMGEGETVDAAQVQARQDVQELLGLELVSDAGLEVLTPLATCQPSPLS